MSESNVYFLPTWRCVCASASTAHIDPTLSLTSASSTNHIDSNGYVQCMDEDVTRKFYAYSQNNNDKNKKLHRAIRWHVSHTFDCMRCVYIRVEPRSTKNKANKKSTTTGSFGAMKNATPFTVNCRVYFRSIEHTHTVDARVLTSIAVGCTTTSVFSIGCDKRNEQCEPLFARSRVLSTESQQRRARACVRVPLYVLRTAHSRWGWQINRKCGILLPLPQVYLWTGGLENCVVVVVVVFNWHTRTHSHSPQLTSIIFNASLAIKKGFSYSNYSSRRPNAFALCVFLLKWENFHIKLSKNYGPVFIVYMCNVYARGSLAGALAICIHHSFYRKIHYTLHPP